MRPLSLPFLLSIFLLLSACGTKTLIRPEENYYDLATTKNSVINIPVRLNMNELERSLNAQLGDVLYEDDSMDAAEGLYIKAEKLDDIKIRIDTQTIRYQLPVKLNVRKDIGFTKVGADGQIKLSFATDFQIQPDWSIATTTEVEKFEWLERPKLSFGGIRLPAQLIGNIVLNRSKEILTKNIDEQIQKNVELKKYVTEAWQQLLTPLEIAPEYSTWLVMNPINLQMSELVGDGDYLTSNIVVEARPEVSIGKAPEAADLTKTPLPGFAYTEKVLDDFVLHLSTDIPYTEAERIAKQEMVGQEFKQGGRAVTVQNIDLYGQGNRLVVVTVLTGSYTGEVYLTGKPVYNERKNTIDLEDIEFELNTKSFLARTAGWLLKSNIKKAIRENMNFLLDANLNDIKKQIQEQLENYELAPNITLQGKLKELKIQDAYLTPFSIRVDIGLEGNVGVSMDGVE